MANNLFRFLTSDGLAGTGSNEDITGAADVHWTGPPDGEIWDIHRIIINVKDTGTVNADTFGALTALTNGCKLELRRGEAQVKMLDFLDGTTIKNNGDWAHMCYDLNISAAAAGAKQVTCRWTFSKGGQPVRLVGGLQERLVFETQDDTTGLVEFSIMAQGVKV